MSERRFLVKKRNLGGAIYVVLCVGALNSHDVLCKLGQPVEIPPDQFDWDLAALTAKHFPELLGMKSQDTPAAKPVPEALGKFSLGGVPYGAPQT